MAVFVWLFVAVVVVVVMVAGTVEIHRGRSDSGGTRPTFASHPARSAFAGIARLFVLVLVDRWEG